MKVKIKKIHKDAKLPVKSKEGDLCYDVWAVSEEEVAPNVWRYKLGFKYEIEREPVYINNSPFGFPIFTEPEFKDFDISIDLRPRSGIWKTGMVLANSEGTLDEFYRGEAMAVFYHVLPDMPRYKAGERIGQIKIGMAPKVEFIEVDEINEDTERGDAGFGSTGNK